MPEAIRASTCLDHIEILCLCAPLPGYRIGTWSDVAESPDPLSSRDLPLFDYLPRSLRLVAVGG